MMEFNMSDVSARYPVLSLETAPEEATPVLEGVIKTIGKMPNMIGTMANSPLTLKSYADIGGNFREAGFSPIEQHVTFLTISVENECRYCTAAHSTALKKGMKVDAAVVSAIRSGGLPEDPRLNALVAVIRELMTQKGRVSDEARTAFLAAGYTERQLLDLLSAIAMKTITNFLDHLTAIPLDEGYVPEAD